MTKTDKLKLSVEREVNTHLNMVMESTVDAIVLHVRKQNIPVDRDSMTHILELFRKFMPGQHLALLDQLMERLDSSLNKE
jgi:hypothetical protein